VANVYYSVGQNSNDHSSGGNVSITSGIATFDTAQVATNLGVGDRLTYGGHICYLASKTSTTVWSVVTALGVAPADHASTTVDSIAHEYTSLSAAEAGASDANHLNTANLVTGTYHLFFPLYNDGATDSTDMVVSGYTTNSTYYIKFYTPTNTSTECNQSQRHTGKAKSGGVFTGFTKENTGGGAAITVSDDYITVQGVIFWATGNYCQGMIIDYPATYPISRENLYYKFGEHDSNYCGLSLSDYSGASSYNDIFVKSKLRVKKDQSANVYIYNASVYGAVIDAGTLGYGVVRNSVASSFEGTFNAASSNNASEDATAPGANSLINQTLTNISWVSTDTNTEDLHINSGSTLKDAGVDLSGIFTTDIDGVTRTGTWDIGADEYVAAGGGLSIPVAMADYRQMRN